MKIKAKNKGLTLIESIIMMLIFMFIISGAMTVFKFAAKEVRSSNITKEQITVESAKSNPLPAQNAYSEYNNKAIISKPEPVIEKITENHYHFEALLTISKYIGFGILGLFTIFTSIKSISLLKKYLLVKAATKNSKKILVKFDNEFEDNKNYLSFIRKISDQVVLNSVLIDNRKNKESVLDLIVTNENLKDKLNFLENNFVKTMK